MTVKELIERLKKVDPDKELSFHCPDGYEDSVKGLQEDENCVTLAGTMADKYPEKYRE